MRGHYTIHPISYWNLSCFGQLYHKNTSASFLKLERKLVVSPSTRPIGSDLSFFPSPNSMNVPRQCLPFLPAAISWWGVTQLLGFSCLYSEDKDSLSTVSILSEDPSPNFSQPQKAVALLLDLSLPLPLLLAIKTPVSHWLWLPHINRRSSLLVSSSASPVVTNPVSIPLSSGNTSFFW